MIPHMTKACRCMRIRAAKRASPIWPEKARALQVVQSA